MRYQIPAMQDNVRTFKDPNGDESRRIVVALINLRDLPDLPLNPDPRVPQEKGDIVKTIRRSALSNDGRFHEKNRGITISAHAADYDNKAKILTLDLSEGDPAYGIVDGGHTHHAIRTAVAEASKNISSDDPLTAQFVRLEIMVGVETELAAIAQARNFSEQLKAFSLSAYEGKFEWLKKALGKKSDCIEFRENEGQPVPVMEVVQVFCALNTQMYPTEDTSPVEAYNNAAKCLKAFVADNDANGFQAFRKIADDVVCLYDYIRRFWDGKYDEADEHGRRGRIKARTEMDKRQRNRESKLIFYFLEDEPVKKDSLPVEKGCAIPVLSSFRVLLNKNDATGEYEWIRNPFEFFDKHGTKLVREAMRASADKGGDMHLVGRDKEVYRNLHRLARLEYYSDMLNVSGTSAKTGNLFGVVR